MEKRLPLALLLSFLVLLAWQFFSPKRPPAEPPQPPAATSPQSPAPAAAAPASAPAADAAAAAPDVSPRVEDTEERTLTLAVGKPGERGSYRAVFTNRGARLLDLRCGDFYVQAGLTAEQKLDPENWTHLLDSAEASGRPTSSLALHAQPSAKRFERAPLEDSLWAMRELADPAGVEFSLAPGTGVRFVKRVLFEPGAYHLRVELEVANEAVAETGTLSFRFTPAEVIPVESGDTFYQEPQAIAAGRKATAKPFEAPEYHVQPRVTTGTPREDTFRVPSDPLSFAGVDNKYFAVLMRGADPFSGASLRGATWRSLHDDAWAAEHPDKVADAWRFIASDVALDLELPPQGQSKKWSYFLFAGPKEPQVLAAESPDYEVLVKHDLGFFSGIATVLLWVLGFFHRLTGNWGVAIILLTVSVRALLFPINRRSQTSMARYQKKMKRVQPQIDELKKRYAADPAKLRAEQGALMQKEGLFPPLGGCLPVFLQIPVFFGLFSALRTSFDLRQAPFAFWIKDLAKPDHLMLLNWHTGLPLIGTIEYLNLLPPLMVVLWVLQQMVMPKPLDEQQARMQKMMMFMPVFMGFFLYNYAAGLSLYMITQSVLGIAEQTVIKKRWPLDDREPEKKAPGFLAKLAAASAEQQRRQQQQKPGPRGGAQASKGAKGNKSPKRH